MISDSDIQAYIDLVRSGDVAVCREQLLLCDYVESCFDMEPIWVDKDQLQRYFLLERYFPFQLLSWERFCFALHNCVYREDGQLRWPSLLIYVGRGAGKNGYLAFEDFCLLTPTNGVQQYHIDIFATSEDQARTSFDDVYNVLEDHKTKLERYFDWNKEIITNKKTKSKLRFRTSGFKTKDGGRPGKVDFDEYHAYENWKMVDVATTGLGKKPFPRKTIITTDGDVRDGPLDSLIARSMQILEGGIEDNGLLPFICRLDDEEEVNDKSKWPKANPSLQYFPTLRQELEIEYADYKENPAANASFMTKRMNRPQGNKDIEVASWDDIVATNRSIPDLTGLPCVAGVDYAKTQDFVAAGLLFHWGGCYYWITHTWVCAKSADLTRIKAPLWEWEKAGLLTLVDAPEIDPGIPAAWLESQAQNYNVMVLGIDNFRYTLLRRALNEHGFDTDKGGANNILLMKKVTQMRYAPIITSLFINHKIVWGDNPLMRWYTNNACITTSKDGNMTFEKIEPKSRKTDGFMALVAAICASDELEDGEAIGGFGTFVKTY